MRIVSAPIAALLMTLPALPLLLAGCNLDTRTLLQNFDSEEGVFEQVDVRDLDLNETPPTLDGGTYVGTLGPSDIGAGLYSGASCTRSPRSTTGSSTRSRTSSETR